MAISRRARLGAGIALAASAALLLTSCASAPAAGGAAGERVTVQHAPGIRPTFGHAVGLRLLAEPVAARSRG